MAGNLAPNKKRGGLSPCDRQGHMGMDPNILGLKAKKLIYVLIGNRGGRSLQFHALYRATYGGVPVHTVDGSVVVQC